MSKTIEPTVGRIVWYRDKDDAIRAAIVVGVNSTFNLNLFVFGYSSSDRVGGYMDSVTHADPEEEPGCKPSWHWMPYQLSQAGIKPMAAVETKTYADGAKATGPAPLPDVSPVERRLFSGLPIGEALLALKRGHRVARAGWNGKGMWLILVPGTPQADLREGTPYAKALQTPSCEILPHIDMWTVNAEGRRAMLPGWVASQTDMLAEDWLIVDDTARRRPNPGLGAPKPPGYNPYA